MKTIALLVLLISLVACKSTPQNIEQGFSVYRDPYKELIRYSAFSDGSLEGQNFGDLQFVYLDVFVDQTPDLMAMAIAVIYQADNWMFINGGESLILMVDGQRMGLTSPDGSLYSRKLTSGVMKLREEALYALTEDNLRKIAMANTVTLRVYGSEGYIERSLSKQQIAYYKMFYEKFIIPYGPSAAAKYSQLSGSKSE